MKSQKVSAGQKRTRRVPLRGTPEYQRWHRNVVAGMRRSRMRRRKAGLLSIAQVAREHGVPASMVRRMVDRGEICRGPGGYIWEHEAARALGQGKGSAA
jgi:hypothetical protein